MKSEGLDGRQISQASIQLPDRFNKTLALIPNNGTM